MKKIILMCLFTITLFAKVNYGDVVVTNIVSVYDGDTISVDIDAFPKIIGQKISIRINKIDTPEIRGRCQKEKDLAIKARDLVYNLVKESREIVLKNMTRDKYFRIGADLYVDGKNVADILIFNSLAVEYYGGKKLKVWCE